jgi:transposase InsO family protein
MVCSNESKGKPRGNALAERFFSNLMREWLTCSMNAVMAADVRA